MSFLSNIGGFFGKAKCYLMVAAIAAGTGWYKVKLDRQLAGKDKTIAEQTTEIGNLTTARDALIHTINERNAEVEKWKEVSETLEGNQSKLLAKIGDIKNSTAAAVTKILDEAIPETCEKAIDYLVDSKGELEKW